jgi:hypothetical protein
MLPLTKILTWIVYGLYLIFVINAFYSIKENIFIMAALFLDLLSYILLCLVIIYSFYKMSKEVIYII